VSAVRGVITGSLGLTALYVLVQKTAASNVGGAFDLVTGLINRWMSPSVPLVPDLRTSNSKSASIVPSGDTTSSGSSSTTSPTTTPTTLNT
jgi:hypothetical protein